MFLYDITHITSFSYEGPTFGNRNIVKMTPRGGIVNWEIETMPEAGMSEFSDRLGNLCTLAYLSGEHRKLKISARGRVQITELEGDPDSDFAEETIFADYSDDSLECSKGGSVEEIIKLVRSKISYEAGATDVLTRASDVFKVGKGVCQDYSHAALAALRQAGYTSRYVAGYLFGEGAMHAWIDVWNEKENKWTAWDPTHETTNANSLLPVAIGRDYSDTAPVSGVYIGEGAAETNTSVKMELVDLYSA